jgi:acyl dehydratase
VTTLTLSELARSARRDLGRSSWHLVDQERVNLFAAATGDRQWIHVDAPRAADGPFGGPVAHGYLTLALLPVLLGELLTVADGTTILNYGAERIRFPAPVRVGSRVRLHAVLVAAERREAGVLCRFDVTVDGERSPKPVLVGEILYLAT